MESATEELICGKRFGKAGRQHRRDDSRSIERLSDRVLMAQTCRPGPELAEGTAGIILHVRAFEVESKRRMISATTKSARVNLLHTPNNEVGRKPAAFVAAVTASTLSAWISKPASSCFSGRRTETSCPTPSSYRESLPETRGYHESQHPLPARRSADERNNVGRREELRQMLRPRLVQIPQGN